MAAISSLSLAATVPAGTIHTCINARQRQKTSSATVRCLASGEDAGDAQAVPRRLALASIAASTTGLLAARASDWALAAPVQSLPKTDDSDIKLCDAECEKNIEQLPLQTTASGLQYRDIVKGKGPSPPVGFQVAADYVAMVPSGRVFDSSIEKKVPYIFRVGSGAVVPGLDEGILTMSVGGLRRLYIPGDLSFPKGLPSAPGRPRVPPNSPVIFDVKLLYIPGLELDDEEEEEPAPAPAPAEAPSEPEGESSEV